MDALTAYLEETYQRIRLLRRTDKSEAWLVMGPDGQLAVIKRLATTGLPLIDLQKANCSLCPRIFYHAVEAGVTILVEEYIAGESMDRLAAKGEYLEEGRACDLMLQLARGLSLLHGQGIIHRDIKPSNLLMEKGGTLRLIDFDAARHVKEGAGEDTIRLGTKGYAPPEQFGYGQTDARSDIYALGMTFKHLLPPDYAGFLRPVLRKCTAMDPEDRYQSAEELAESIRHRQLLQKIRLPLTAVLCLGLLALVAYFHTHGAVPYENLPAEGSLTEPLTSVPEQEISDQSGSQTGANALRSSLAAENSPADAPLAPQQTTIQPQSTGIAVAPVAENPVSPEIPQASVPPPSTESILRGHTTSSLIWNGIPVGGNASLPLSITPAQWQSGIASLVISNDSNLPREGSSVKLVYSSNYGNRLTTQADLPYLEPGQSTRLSIPCGAVFPIEDMSSRIWVQIYLEGSNVPDREKYWCLQFEMEGEGQ